MEGNEYPEGFFSQNATTGAGSGRPGGDSSASYNTEKILGHKVTPYYQSLIDINDPDCPIRKQCRPDAAERIVHPCESSDPLCEEMYMPVRRAVHRYKRCLLVLLTGRCSVNCRHCFRRARDVKDHGPATNKELVTIAGYIKKHTEIHEVLISGGDPLYESPGYLKKVLPLLKTRDELLFRVGTRIPVTDPERVTDETIAALSEVKPVWVITQFNHPREMTQTAKKAVDKMVEKGIPVLNQTVLLKGVNDTVEILEKLFTALPAWRIKPYYLFQTDLAPGTSHFRVPLDRAVGMYTALQSRLGGMSLPLCAVDLPGGGGKKLLGPDCVSNQKNGCWQITGNDGKTYQYPAE